MKRLLTLTLVVAAAALVGLAGPALAQNAAACLLDGSYVARSVVTLPGQPDPVYGIGTFQFARPFPFGTPPCIENPALAGPVSVNSALLDLDTAVISQGPQAFLIPFGDQATLLGLVGQIEGGIARGFVFQGLSDAGISFSGTALRVQE
jgi:hypothetical protein